MPRLRNSDLIFRFWRIASCRVSAHAAHLKKIIGAVIGKPDLKYVQCSSRTKPPSTQWSAEGSRRVWRRFMWRCRKPSTRGWSSRSKVATPATPPRRASKTSRRRRLRPRTARNESRVSSPPATKHRGPVRAWCDLAASIARGFQRRFHDLLMSNSTWPTRPVRAEAVGAKRAGLAKVAAQPF